MGSSHAVGQPEERRQEAVPPRWQIIRGRDATQGYIMVAPAIILLIVLVAYPFCLALWLSLTNKTVGTDGTFVGLHNFTNQLNSQIFKMPSATRPGTPS